MWEIPDRIMVELLDWTQVLIQIHIDGEGIVRVVGRTKVCDAARWNSQTPENWTKEKGSKPTNVTKPVNQKQRAEA